MMVSLCEVGHLLAIFWTICNCSAPRVWRFLQWGSCCVRWDWPSVGHFLNYFLTVLLQKHGTLSNDSLACEVSHLLAIFWTISTCSTLGAWRSLQWWSNCIKWDWPSVGHFLNYFYLFCSRSMALSPMMVLPREVRLVFQGWIAASTSGSCQNVEGQNQSVYCTKCTYKLKIVKYYLSNSAATSTKEKQNYKISIKV